MSIDSINTNKQYKSINNQIKHKIQQRESELKRLDDYYDSKSANLRDEGLTKLYERRNQNNNALINASQTHQEKMENYSKSISDIQNKLNQEKQSLKSSQRDSIKGLDNDFSLKIEKKYEDTNNYAKDIDNKNKNYLNSLNQQSNNDIRIAERENDHKIQIKSQEFEREIKNAEKNYERELRRSMLEMEKENSSEISNNKATVHALHQKQELDRVKQQQIHEKLVAQNKMFYDKLIKQNSKSFAQKIQTLQDDQQLLMSRIYKRFNTDIQEMLQAHSKIKNNMVSREDDSFYQVTEIHPKVQERENDYLISLEIPEYEKEFVNFNANLRKLTISLARRSNGSLEKENGDKLNSKKSEIIEKQFNVDQIIDPTKVTQNYSDGILTFKIAKL